MHSVNTQDQIWVLAVGTRLENCSTFDSSLGGGRRRFTRMTGWWQMVQEYLAHKK